MKIRLILKVESGDGGFAPAAVELVEIGPDVTPPEQVLVLERALYTAWRDLKQGVIQEISDLTVQL